MSCREIANGANFRKTWISRARQSLARDANITGLVLLFFDSAMSSATRSLSIPTLDVDGDAVHRALLGARAPVSAVAAARPELRSVLAAARAACRQLGAAPRPELLHQACLVRFDAAAWPERDFHRCVLTCVAAHWLGAGQPFGWLEQGPSVFRPLDTADIAAVSQPPAEVFRTAEAALRPAFQPQVLSWTCCANRTRSAIGVVAVDSLVAALPAGLRETARQARFRHEPGTADVSASAPSGLFWNSPRGTMAALDLCCTIPARCGDAAALQALREIDAAARQRAVWLVLQPGEVLFLRNHRVLHATRWQPGACRMLCAQWRESLLALGNFAGTGMPGVFSMARLLRPAGAR